MRVSNRLHQFAAAIAIASSLVLAAPSSAQELKIAVAADVTSMDPHFFNLFPNNNMAEHIFDKLVQMSPDSQMIPGLATSWKPIDDKTWEFKLRKGVKFHDGSELTAEDVAFSIDRVALIPNSPGPFVAYTKAIVGKEIVDPYTIRFKTAAPHPLMPNDLSTIYIVSKKVATGATTEDFNSGKVTIGSGRYKLVRYVNGDKVELVRNDNYWGDKPGYEKVTFRIIKDGASRMASLLSGDVDAIEQPPTADLARLKSDPKFTLTSKISHRVIYFNFDHLSRVSPFITAKDGKPLDKNPLKDPRVRKALSMMINRPAIVERVMEGEAVPAGQLVPDFLFGATKNLKVEPFNLEGGKKLLAEAGYPDGFGITLHATNNRYVNDAKIAQAIAQMWTRGGILTKVVAMPSATFFPQATDLKFSVLLAGWSTGTGESSSSLKALLMTFNKDKGFGTANRGRYSNTKVDALTEDALQIVDDVKREAYLQRAAELAIGDTGLIPLHFQISLWATRDGIAYTPRVDEQTLAWKFTPKK